MIPILVIDEENIKEQWKSEEDQKQVMEICQTNFLMDSDLPVYSCDSEFVKLGVFKRYSGIDRDFDLEGHYGYTDSAQSLEKYLKNQGYLDDEKTAYFIRIYGLSMDNEKYYKHGSYIDLQGVDTQDDYYSWISEHPEDKDKQQYPGLWIAFIVHKLIEKNNE